MTNFTRTVFYTGVSGNLDRRIRDHKQGVGSTFTSKYKCYYLVYYEDFNDIRRAIAREKQLKKWNHTWKLALIRKENPDMLDLAASWK